VRSLALGLVGFGVLGVAAWLGWNAVRHPPSGQLSADWSPAAPLAPGVSIREGKVSGAPAWRVLDLSMDPARAELRTSSRPGGARLAALVPAGAVAAVNGGYFDERFRPTGWLLDHGHELAPKQVRAQGGVLAVKSGALYIGPLNQLPFAPELALQNSPRLVEAPGAVGIRSDDKKRASRTVACDVNGRLHLVVIAAPVGEGPTLLETARFLAREPDLGGMGCGAALNLDGGPSSAIWLAPSVGIPGISGAASIAYVLAVLPR
jgi:hypothetical protein